MTDIVTVDHAISLLDAALANRTADGGGYTNFYLAVGFHKVGSRGGVSSRKERETAMFRRRKQTERHRRGRTDTSRSASV